jgi:hypothetical protein
MPTDWRTLAADLARALDGMEGDGAIEAVGALASLQARALRASLRSEDGRLMTVE